METLPYDVFLEVLKGRSVDDIRATCTVNKANARWCRKAGFWHDLIGRSFGVMTKDNVTVQDYLFFYFLANLPPLPDNQDKLDALISQEIAGWKQGQLSLFRIVNRLTTSTIIRDELAGLIFQAYTPAGALLKYYDLNGGTGKAKRTLILYEPPNAETSSSIDVTQHPTLVYYDAASLPMPNEDDTSLYAWAVRQELDSDNHIKYYQPYQDEKSFDFFVKARTVAGAIAYLLYYTILPRDEEWFEQRPYEGDMNLVFVDLFSAVAGQDGWRLLESKNLTLVE